MLIALGDTVIVAAIGAVGLTIGALLAFLGVRRINGGRVDTATAKDVFELEISVREQLRADLITARDDIRAAKVEIAEARAEAVACHAEITALRAEVTRLRRQVSALKRAQRESP